MGCYTPNSPCFQLKNNSLLLRDTLVAWKGLRKKFGLSYQLSKLLPIWSHVEFSEGKNSKLFDAWKSSELATVGQLFHYTENRYKTLSEIAGEFGVSESHCLQYLQLKCFCVKRLKDITKEKEATEFYDIVGGGPCKRSLAILYRMIRDKYVRSDTHTFFASWKRWLQIPNISSQMLSGWQIIKKCVISEKWRESHFKMMHAAIYAFNIPPDPNYPSKNNALS